MLVRRDCTLALVSAEMYYEHMLIGKPYVLFVGGKENDRELVSQVPKECWPLSNH